MINKNNPIGNQQTFGNIGLSNFVDNKVKVLMFLCFNRINVIRSLNGLKKFFCLVILLSFVFPCLLWSRVSDEEFLNLVSHDSFYYFWEQCNQKNGLIKDSNLNNSPCSIAAVGFGLTAYCIGVQNKWISKNEAYIRILRTLRTFYDRVQHEHGFFYHFLDINNCSRVWNCELSSIDTTIFLAGALTAGEYFKGTEIETLANKIYNRVDWPWMLNRRKVLCMGWKPKEGFLPFYWDSYNELMLIYALAIGSPTHPIPKESWDAWSRPKAKYGKSEFIYCPTGSLFVHQYSHAWIDFRNKQDNYADYWENSVKATLSNRQYCIEISDKYQDFGENMWGLSACVGPYGYRGYGGGPGNPYTDGTISPSAVAGSIVFCSTICINTLRFIFDEYAEDVYCRYGYRNGFNLELDWFAKECLGIDQGITLLMIENYRSGFVWKYFMRHPSIQKWLSLCFFDRKKN